ncbi:MAG: hypothetical protein ACKOFH_15860, partial [Chthoniobacterales bacterium]
LEYGAAFGFPVWVNRCGVMAGAGQFGKPDQGIFSFWIHSWARQAPLKYIGFGGTGHLVRDCLHPEDLVDLVLKQMERGGRKVEGRRQSEEAADGLRDKRAEGLEDAETKGDLKFQIGDLRAAAPRIFNVSGGIASAMSLRQLSDWCAGEIGPREVGADLTPRPCGLAWGVLVSSPAAALWDWKPRRSVQSICSDIAQHARENPGWLAISRG